MHVKEEAKQVLDEILRNNSKPYKIVSCEDVGDLSRRLELFYADSFVDFARTQKNSRFAQEFAKFHNCATTYGYRGFSARKNNGIVDIKPTDTQLLEDYEKLLTNEVIKQYGLDAKNLKPVKVVAHVTNGNRPVGVLDRTQKSGRHTVVILGMSNYRGKPK